MDEVNLQHLAISAGLSGCMIALAVVARSLSFSGALAGWVVGFLVLGFGGVALAAPLVAFFVTSSVLSRLPGRERSGAAQERGSRRDAVQVLANGGVPAALAVACALHPSSRLLAMLCLAALAAANADTWATEIGSRAGRRPRLVSTWRPVEPGVSGAVSLAGILAALLGAAAVVAVGVALWPHGTGILFGRPDIAEALALAWAGFLGSYLDSLLGASVQATWRCGVCGCTTERRTHCGAPAARVRGVRWIDNDVVNILSVAGAVLIAWALLHGFAYPR
ncbi:MAG TPA: DUF92 domain-containing protein [Chthonomonadales bacterium]|nr:DUF92 domain-containing protein [Chthonomonadales bacterium]